MIAPCKDCPERGCGAKHDTCEAYQAFVKSCAEAREQRRREVEAVSNHYDRIRRMTRRDGKQL